MKKVLFSLLILWITGFVNANPVTKHIYTLIPEISSIEQAPFNFMNPVSSRIKLDGEANLSFYVNGAIVFQYRFRMECPSGGESSIEKAYLSWSPWITDDIKNIRIAKLTKDGKYTLAIEYRSHTSADIRRFEKSFEVYDPNPPLIAEKTTGKTVVVRDTDRGKEVPPAAGSGSKVPVNENLKKEQEETQGSKTAEATKPDIAAEKKAEPKPSPAEKPVAETKPVSADKSVTETKPVTAEKPVAVEKPVTNEPSPAAKPLPAEKKVVPEQPVARDYDKLITEAIGKNDPVLLKELINAGAGRGFKGENGGNIFHLLGNRVAGEDLITVIKNKGFSINEADNFGNTPLHFALLSGDTQYAKSLLNQGANIAAMNKMELSPLHLATYLNNIDIVKEMMKKGIKVDLKGNTGYTPLHIAAEMNHPEIASIFLNRGASAGLKTGQKLNSKMIAGIQQNKEMKKLISKDGKYSFGQSMNSGAAGSSLVRLEGTYPQIDFNLPYDSQLAKRRQLFGLIQKISVPVFVIGAAGTAWLHLTANDYYSKYKAADTQDIAQFNYDKTLQFDTYTYIAGGVSLIPVYTFIHSTILKNSTSKKMRKQIN